MVLRTWGQCHRGGPLGILNRGPAHGREQLTLAGDGGSYSPSSLVSNCHPHHHPQPHETTQSPGPGPVQSHLQALAPALPLLWTPFLVLTPINARPPSRLCTNVTFSRDHLTTWSGVPAPLGLVPPMVPAARPFLVSLLCFGFCLGARPPSTVGSLMAGIKFVFCPKESMSVN